MRFNTLEKVLNSHANAGQSFSVTNFAEHDDDYQIYMTKDASEDPTPINVAKVDGHVCGRFIINASAVLSNNQIKAIRRFADTDLKKRNKFEPKNKIEELAYNLAFNDDYDNSAFKLRYTSGECPALYFIGYGRTIMCYMKYDTMPLSTLDDYIPDDRALFLFDFDTSDLLWINHDLNFKQVKIIDSFANSTREMGGFLRKDYQGYEEFIKER